MTSDLDRVMASRAASLAAWNANLSADGFCDIDAHDDDSVSWLHVRQLRASDSPCGLLDEFSTSVARASQ